MNNRRLLSTPEAAERIGVSPSILNKWRLSAGEGPPFAKIGACVRYDPDDLDAWVQSRKRSSTADGEVTS